jgi:hypothetical protein
MEEDEDTHHHSSCDYRQRQSNPVGISPLDRLQHQTPQETVRNKCVEELPKGFAEVRRPVSNDGLMPGWRRSFQFRSNGIRESLTLAAIQNSVQWRFLRRWLRFHRPPKTQEPSNLTYRAPCTDSVQSQCCHFYYHQHFKNRWNLGS